MKETRRPLPVPRFRALVRRRRLTWLEALGLVATVNALVVLAGAALVTRTDPDRFPDLGTGLWWAVATVTTVGYGDVVPVTAAGRLVASALMFVGIGSFAFLTAVAASAIVVGEVGEEERLIEREEREIQRMQEVILDRLAGIDARLERLERSGSGLPAGPAAPAPLRGGADIAEHLLHVGDLGHLVDPHGAGRLHDLGPSGGPEI